MTRFRLFANALAIGGLIAVTPPAHAQSAASTAPVAKQQAHQATQMMDMQKMMADMKAMDAKLEALVIKMNTAKGNARVDAIAELLTATIQQNRTMHDGMMQVHGQMMMQMHGEMMKPMGGDK